MDPLALVALVGVGVVTGFINTVAGGGSLITLPVLILFGLPADVANATNRVAILGQSIWGTILFDRKKALDRQAALWISIPTVISAVAGSYLATRISVQVLEPVLLIATLLMGISMLAQPRLWKNSEQDTPPTSLRKQPWAIGGLLLAGFYGGFLQAGVGFWLLAIFLGLLRYDLLRANAIKLLVVIPLSLVSIAIFWQAQLIAWLPGSFLALGAILGAWIASHVSLRPQAQKPLRIFVFVMLIATCSIIIVRLFER